MCSRVGGERGKCILLRNIYAFVSHLHPVTVVVVVGIVVAAADVAAVVVAVVVLGKVSDLKNKFCQQDMTSSQSTVTLPVHF